MRDRAGVNYLEDLFNLAGDAKTSMSEEVARYGLLTVFVSITSREIGGEACAALLEKTAADIRRARQEAH